MLVVLSGCGGVRPVVTLDMGAGRKATFVPRQDARVVELEDAEASLRESATHARPSSRPQQAARELFQMEARSGSYRYEPRERRITPLGAGEPLEVIDLGGVGGLTQEYLRWCERTQRHGDCLRLLSETPILDGDGRYVLAMALARGVGLSEMMDAFQDMADPEAMMAAVLWTWTTYMVLLAVPEPISKGIAAVMTATLIAYVGIDTFWGLIVGFRQWVEAADRALTFDDLRQAGERYGKLMGRNAARAFVMLATAAMGNTAAGLAGRVPTLPGAAQATAQAGAQLGIRLSAVGEVRAVSIGAGTVTLALAPGAVAMAAQGKGGGNPPPAPGVRSWGSFSGFKRAMGPAGAGQQWHHVVEQTPGNVERFGPHALHNTDNVIRLDARMHARIGGIFSSIRADLTRSYTVTVRQWLGTQSFEEQRRFGMLVLEKVMKGEW
ncbi:SitA5 family polymorphic toxin [Corallococcus carmarthensis]|uniref:SitA5 family polymorphic toxin n=1 Tax=Corallococcus carmarthensis TaxID=2316728 RepID=UPI003F6DD640